MRIIEALGALQFLTKNLISLSDIAEALGKTKGAISNRHNKVDGRSDELKPEEIKQLSIYFNVDIEGFIQKINAAQNTQDKKLVQEVKKTMIELLNDSGLYDMAQKLSEQQ